MHYEHTISAVISLILGIVLLVDYFLVTFFGYQWLPFEYPTTSIFVEILHILIYWAFAFSPLMIVFGYLGIKREFEIRDLEHGAHRVHYVNKRSIKHPGRHSREK